MDVRSKLTNVVIPGVTRHASDFSPGSVIFVVDMVPGIWWLGPCQPCSLRSP